MIFKILDNLRKKSESTRRTVTIGASLIATVVAGTVWGVSYAGKVQDSLHATSTTSLFSSFHQFAASVSSGIPSVSDAAASSSLGSGVADTASSGDVNLNASSTVMTDSAASSTGEVTQASSSTASTQAQSQPQARSQSASKPIQNIDLYMNMYGNSSSSASSGK